MSCKLLKFLYPTEIDCSLYFKLLFYIRIKALLKFSGNVPYIIRKINYLWILIILINKNLITKIKKKKNIFWNFCYNYFFKLLEFTNNVFFLIMKGTFSWKFEQDCLKNEGGDRF